MIKNFFEKNREAIIQLVLMMAIMLLVIFLGNYVGSKVYSSEMFNASMNQWLLEHPNATLPTNMIN